MSFSSASASLLALVTLAAQTGAHAQEPGPGDPKPDAPGTGEEESSAAALERAAREVSVPELTFESLGRWRAHIRPRADELAWQSIPWATTFAEGVRRAHDEQKPLLFWAMNGHPLGCT